MKEKNKPTKEKQTTGGPGPDIFSPEDDGLVTVTSGPYAEQLPLAGMKVAAIREKFGDRFDIDPAAQAVVDGHDVGNDTMVLAGQVLMFVRRAGEKGAAETEITIKGALAIAESPEGAKASMPLKKLMDAVSHNGPNTGDIILPTGVKMVVSAGAYTIWVYEMPPAVQNLKWIAADSAEGHGSGVKYLQVRLGLPYVIIMALFGPMQNGKSPGTYLSQRNECFFRNEPLKSTDDELFYPALLNCSKFKRQDGNPLSWICTQYVNFRKIHSETDINKRMRLGLTKLKHCLFETGFNRSSELNEGASWFSECVDKGIDKRLKTVEAWEEASKKDPLFVLEVPWIKTGLSVKSIAQRMFNLHGTNGADNKSVNALAAHIFNHNGKA